MRKSIMISDLADSVLRDANQPVVKSAGVTHHGDAMVTDLGKQLSKVAGIVRKVSDGADEITYEDLENFKVANGL